MTSTAGRRAWVCVWVAFGAGMTHAAISGYWALGGRWLLNTVGPWAEKLGEDAPIFSAALLGAIATLKIIASIVPILLLNEPIRPPRLWRAACWLGGGFLLAYGGVNVVVANAVLLGTVGTESDYNAPAMIGHAYLWDPLFALWGAALMAAMWFSRPGRTGVR